jgi:hypothetical protein
MCSTASWDVIFSSSADRISFAISVTFLGEGMGGAKVGVGRGR